MYGFNLEWQKMFLVQNLSVQSDLQSDHNEYQHFQCEKKSIPFTLGILPPKKWNKGKRLPHHDLFHLRSTMHKIRTRWQRSIILHFLPCHVFALPQRHFLILFAIPKLF